MKERLTTRVFGQTYTINQRIYYDDIVDIAERLAELEDKIESGELVEKANEETAGEKACEDCKSQASKETVKEILKNLKTKLIERYNYFSALYKKNMRADLKDNRLFDLGEMDCASCLIDYLKLLAEEYGVEIEE